MTDKRYQLRQEDLDYPIYSDLVDTANNDKVICSFELDVGTSEMVDLLNEQDERIKGLEKENRGLQFKIIDMLDFVKEKGTVTREEIKKWWNDVE